MVRTWAFQALGFDNKRTRTVDFTGIDRVEPEASDCQPGSVGGACYGRGVCAADASDVLRRFCNELGGTIHRLDPGALVSSGTIGSGQCGIAGGGFGTVHASPGADIASFHDDGAPRTALTGELAERIRQAGALAKPLLVGEVGVGGSGDAADVARGCPSLGQRADPHAVKRRAAFAAGADGYLPWWFAPGREGGCTDSLSPGDPLLPRLTTSLGRLRRLRPVWQRVAPMPPGRTAHAVAPR